MRLSNHAAHRMQQRGIPPLIIDWLEGYGSSARAGHGTEKFYFDKKSRRMLARDVGKAVLRNLEKQMNAYMVCRESTVLTVGHRYRRVRH